MAFIIEDEVPGSKGFVIEDQKKSPAPTPTQQPSHLGAALSGVGEGLAGFADLAKYLGRELVETPSRVGQMIQNPSMIPGVAAQTGKEALAVLTDPKAIAAGVGTALGGPGVGTSSAVGYQVLHDLIRKFGGESVSPQEVTKNLAATATSFGTPGAIGKVGAKTIGGATRLGAKAFPGSAVALQKDVLEQARNAVAGVPRPPLPEDPAVLAAQRASQAGQIEAQNAANMAAYETRLRQAQAAGIERIREAGNIPFERNPYSRFEEPSQALEAFEMLKQAGESGPIRNVRPPTARGGIPIETVPTGQIAESLAATRDTLQPIIKAWKLSPSPLLVKSAEALEKSLATTGMTMTLPDVVRFMRDVGRLVDRPGEVGGAASRLYRSAIEDLEAHGSEAALAAREAAKQWRRKKAVESIQSALNKAIASKGGELVPSPDRLLRVLQSPSGKAESAFMKRINASLTPEERANLLADLKGSVSNFPEKPAKLSAPAATPQPERISSLQEVLESAKAPVQGVGGGVNVDLERVIRQLPTEGAGALESPLAEFLRGKMTPEDVATLRTQLEKLQGVKRVTSGSPSYMERLPIYSLLAPLLSVTGLGAVGGGGGAAAAVIPASIVASEMATRGLKNLAATPTMQRLLLRAYRNRMGENAPSLGGTLPGMAENLTREERARAEKRKPRRAR